MQNLHYTQPPKAFSLLPRCKTGLIPLVVLICLCAFVPKAEAQVVIYKAGFDRQGTSVNYPRPLFGYFVVDTQSGAFTSVALFLGTAGDLHYYASPFVTGSWFRVTGRFGRTFDVLAGGSSGTGENLALQLAGSTSGRVNIGGGESMRLAKRLKGEFFLSGADSTSTGEEDTPSVFTAGFFGFAEVTARLDQGLTRRFNSAELDSATALAELEAVFERQGIFPLESDEEEIASDF